MSNQEQPLPKRDVTFGEIDNDFREMINERNKILNITNSDQSTANFEYSFTTKFGKLGSINADISANFHPVRELISMTATAAAVGLIAITSLVKATKWGGDHARKS